MFNLKNKAGAMFEVQKVYDYKLHQTVYVIVRHYPYMSTSQVYNIENMWWQLESFNSLIHAVVYLKKNIEKLI